MDGIPHIRLFSRGDRLYVQAQQIWIILVAFVMHSKRNPKRPEKMTYGDLAKAMGYPDSRAGHGLARQLGIVGEYCVRNRWPALNSIVVNQETDAPGHDVVLSKGRKYNQFKREQGEVMSKDWFALRVPTTGTFRKVWEAIK